MTDNKTKTLIALTIILFLLLIGTSYLGFTLKENLEQTKQELSETKTNLDNKQTENEQLNEALLAEQKRNADFENQIMEITGTVGLLEKLSKIDPELLQKYSKVFFLNEHYVPPKLREISAEFRYPEDKEMKIHASVWTFLKDLLQAAKMNDLDLKVVSAYRSFSEQSSLKSTYTVTYGYGANQFSADQGYSEHQLGTTVDFTTSTLGGVYSSFDQTEEYEWLTENAYKYGFILSYPKNNSYYQYEPWHWRFVGESLAKQLHRENKYFYDLDQREIDEHLAEIFD